MITPMALLSAVRAQGIAISMNSVSKTGLVVLLAVGHSHTQAGA